MAQYCPKCNYKLRITDWRPECPKCGVNVVYYGIEDRLRQEADDAEYRHALIQPKFDRLKFSLIGHKLSVVRLILGLLPIGALFLPLGTVNYNLPFTAGDKTVTVLSAVTSFLDLNLDMGFIKGLLGSQFLGTPILLYLLAMLGLIGVALISLVGWLLLTLSCSKRGMKRNIRLPIAGIISATVAEICFAVMNSQLETRLTGVYSGSVNVLPYILVVVLFAAMITVNVIYKKKNIQVKYKDVSEFLLPYAERQAQKQNAEKSEDGASQQTDGEVTAAERTV